MDKEERRIRTDYEICKKEGKREVLRMGVAGDAVQGAGNRNDVNEVLKSIEERVIQ